MDVVAHRHGVSRLPVWAAVFVVMVCGSILASSGWNEWLSRQNDLRNAEVELGNLTRLLTQHAEDTIELANTTLTGVVGGLETDGTGATAISRLQIMLDLRKASLGRLRGIFVYGETGRWLASTEDVDTFGFNNADRDYFNHHRRSADRSILVGRPILSKSSGQWVIPLSRRWNHADGRFGGVVAVTVDVAYFVQFYRRFDVGPNGTISLVARDGTVLAHSADLGPEPSQNAVPNEIPFLPIAGSLAVRLPQDVFERIGYYQHAERYPFAVLVTRTQADVLAQWSQEARGRLIVVFCLVAVIVLIGIVLVRQLLQGQRMAAAMALKEESFRVLAESSSDLVTRIGLDERISYASPSSARVLGWPPAGLIGRRALSNVHQLDLPHLQDIVASVKRGDVEEARATYRVLRSDKSEIWVESTLCATRKDDGELDGFVAITRDVTQQKTLQGRLEMLAIEDGLTGLANRRRFDERLREEWGRAYRERTSLALLMIDIDHFKTFNDAYGHPAGDACLHAVAAILVKETMRTSDLAARYGGEEFALLLPNTDAAGCELIGARIQSALRNAAIIHRMNIPVGIVTASFGGAACRPGAERSAGPASLIEAADRALYTAKDAGRDRLVMADEFLTLVPIATAV
jgi:diguanylate cyclase (GGDEF)-like protein/PAS domain S-box-containing protein